MKIQKTNKDREKIEFWVHKTRKNKLIEISNKIGCTVSELLRREIEIIIEKYHE